MCTFAFGNNQWTMNKARFNIKLLEQARNFLKSLDTERRAIIIKDLKYASYDINATLFKKLVGTDIWEFRTKAKGLQYRLLAFWDKEQKAMVVATHGFVKKTQKTPEKEINKAIQLKKEYYAGKK